MVKRSSSKSTKQSTNLSAGASGHQRHDTTVVSNRVKIVANIWRGKVWLHINQRNDKSVSLLVAEMSALFLLKKQIQKSIDYIKSRAATGAGENKVSSSSTNDNNKKKKRVFAAVAKKRGIIKSTSNKRHHDQHKRRRGHREDDYVNDSNALCCDDSSSDDDDDDSSTDDVIRGAGDHQIGSGADDDNENLLVENEAMSGMDSETL